MVPPGLRSAYPAVISGPILVPLSPAEMVGLEPSQKAGDIPRAKVLGWEQARSTGLDISLTLAGNVHWETQRDMSQQTRWPGIIGHLQHVLNLSCFLRAQFLALPVTKCPMTKRALQASPCSKIKTLSTTAPVSERSSRGLAMIRHPTRSLLTWL